MRTKRALYNSLTSFIYQLVLIISGLIVPRLILETYGSECNGVVSSATQFLGVVSFLTIGLTGATRVELYKAIAIKDSNQISNIMYSTNQYMHKVAVILCAYTVILAFLYPSISHSTLAISVSIPLILVIGIGKFFEFFWGIPYRILLQADQKNYIEYSFSIISCIFYTLVTVIMVNNGSSIVSVKLVSAVISLIAILMVCHYVKKTYHLKWDKNNSIINLPQRKDAAIHSIANIVHQNSDLVILTLFMDIKEVSVYTVYYFVVGQIKKLMASFTDGLESAFGNMWAKDEKLLFQKRFQVYEYFIYVVVLIVFSCTWTLLLPFIALYTENVNDANYIRPMLASLMTLAEIVYCIRQPYVTIVQAAGKYKETKQIALIEAAINVGSSVTLCIFIGIEGVIIGTLLANVIRTVYYVYYSQKELLTRETRRPITRFGWAVITFIIIISIERVFSIYLPINNWYGWLRNGVIFVLVSTVITVITSLFFENESLGELLKILKRVRRV